MADREALKRLGGGRWETRDGRFTVEPQSGTWVLVDNTATNELGLPLVRGPYPSLSAARDAIDESREAPEPTSPLAEELERSKAATAGRAPNDEPPRGGKEKASRAAPAPAEPEPPPEPRWLTSLGAKDARRARKLLEQVEAAGLQDPERIVRAEVTRDVPSIARAVLERRLAEIVASASDTEDAVTEVAALLARGRDRELGIGWRLVDEDGREIGELEAGG